MKEVAALGAETQGVISTDNSSDFKVTAMSLGFDEVLDFESLSMTDSEIDDFNDILFSSIS